MLQKTGRACSAELAAITLYPRSTSGITALFNLQLREPLLNISAIFLEKTFASGRTLLKMRHFTCRPISLFGKKQDY